ncbi:MAG: TIGR03013 family XrtA/PEP-CTERM system glycosyltransferase [Pseudomonadota bacterium]
MSYIRFRKHYLHIPYLVLAVIEFAVLLGVFIVLTALYAPQSVPAGIEGMLSASFLFAFILSLGTLAMGGYAEIVRETLSQLYFRTLVAYCFLGGIALLLVYAFLPAMDPGSTNLFWAVLVCTIVVIVLRRLFLAMVDSRQLVRRVVIFGAGTSAHNLLADYDMSMRALGIQVMGCLADSAEPTVADDRLITAPANLYRYCRKNRISEIIIAQQERRRSEGGWLPVPDLMECKLRGIAVTNAIDFYERELRKVKLELVHPSWIVFSEGFRVSRHQQWLKRLVDLALSLLLLVISLPFMLLTALAILLETGWPVLYSQNRVGQLGREFRIYKFRSMRKDAEKDGKARWASANDNRVTRVGAFIRNTRLDELPQIYNVIRGDMSFVGPRPERPEFVAELNEKIPYYDTRHYVRPGLMGWAQLKYPYGASIDDARGKLEYDLYYSKNHSLLMDFLIMIQTVEVVLLGKGVR